MAVVRTPGGRIGNDRRTGSRSNGENWVERTRSGSLPRYIRIVRNGLMREGHSESRATALAVAAIKRWARGGSNVSPKVRAAAVAALAQWEKMKAEKGWDGDLEVKRQYSAEKIEELGEQGHAFKNSNGDWSYPIEDREDLKNAILAFGRSKPTDKESLKRYIIRRARALRAEGLIPDHWGQSKGVTVEIEHKSVGVSGIKVVGPEEDGIIEAFVSITGVRDRVGDIIEPGSYEKTLQDRLPKGIWSHDWNQPVSKTLEAKELMPGDPMLPKTLPNGDPWPAGAGALWVKTQFNLDGDRGRQAYSDVKFFGTDQEWSIGYNVPAGKATMSTKGMTKTRNIKGLDLYEYSPVLWGAMPHARTSSVKDAQQANMMFKSLLGENYYEEHDVDELTLFLSESKNFFDTLIETKGLEKMEADEPGEDEDDDRIANTIDYEDDDEDGAKVLELSEADIKLLQDAGDLINQILDGEYKGMDVPEDEEDEEDEDEEIDTEGKTLGDFFDEMEFKDIGDDDFSEIEDKVIGFDEALESGDVKSIEEAAESMLDAIEQKQDGEADECVSDLKQLASVLSAMLESFEAKNDEGWDENDSKPAENYESDEEDDEEFVEDDGKGEKMMTIDADTLGTELKGLQQWANTL
jgi:hypothetical protein